MKIPTYHDVIDLARAYRKTNSRDDLLNAEKILRAGYQDHIYALPIGDELALVLEQLGRDDEALDLLKELEVRHRDTGEETLCRFGKIYKKRAYRFADNGNLSPAINNLADSERYYARAYEKTFGFYPRINQLTARFLRAAMLMRIGQVDEVNQLLNEVKDHAEQMLLKSTVWRERLSDDHIWIQATYGEVNLLLERWPDSERAYREAIRLAQGRQFYHDSMKSQFKIMLEACRHLKIEPPDPFADPEVLFGL